VVHHLRRKGSYKEKGNTEERATFQNLDSRDIVRDQGDGGLQSNVQPAPKDYLKEVKKERNQTGVRGLWPTNTQIAYTRLPNHIQGARHGAPLGRVEELEEEKSSSLTLMGLHRGYN